MSSVSLRPRNMSLVCFVLAAILAAHATAAEECDVSARITTGYVCGARRLTDDDQPFAAFLAVPYAKQPVGELRFKELQPVEPWLGNLDATQPGPVCPQTDILYGPLMTPTSMSEECIHANIYTPVSALPSVTNPPIKELGLPILVFVHGGGFAFGSGDPDLNGPEYLVGNGVVVITFNYRLNVFGFLSLNSTQIPGNNGLRDIITLLRWVKDNAEYFGGNPDDVTLAGQSAGAASVHLLTLSPEAQGLFKRAIILSGAAIGSFYTVSPAYAQFVSKPFIDSLGINSTDPEEIHELLTKVPLEKLMESNRIFQDMYGLTVFFPVIESALPGVRAILPDDPEVLLAKGYGKDIPLLIGFTNKECESFRKRFDEIDILNRIKHNPLIMAPLTTTFNVPPEIALERAGRVSYRYFHGEPTIEGYLKFCTNMFFQYPALKSAEYRSKTGGAPTFLYEFSYNSPNNPVKKAFGLEYKGAGHVEDMTYVLKVNSVPVERDYMDDLMTKLMTRYVLNFMRYDRPSNFESWQKLTSYGVHYQNIVSAFNQTYTKITPAQSDMLNFFDSILARS